MRILTRLAVALLVCYLAFLGVIYAFMRQPPQRFASAIAKMPGPLFLVLPFETLWGSARGGSLHPSDPAPDFKLSTLDRKSQIALSDFRGKQPVVLIFGSYTWPPFRREVPALNQLYREYKDRVAFYIVYIQEAHASDVWQMQANLRQNVVFASPRSFEERGAVAESCVRNLHIEIPALLDGFGNTTETAYTGWPDRLYLIDRDGRVVYKSRPGPFGFHPEELSASLKHL
jgi:peroxiredoxin